MVYKLTILIYAAATGYTEYYYDAQSGKVCRWEKCLIFMVSQVSTLFDFHYFVWLMGRGWLYCLVWLKVKERKWINLPKMTCNVLKLVQRSNRRDLRVMVQSVQPTCSIWFLKHWLPELMRISFEIKAYASLFVWAVTPYVE